MAKLCATLEELGLEFLPSHGNFLMFRLNGEVSEFAERMRGEGFLVGRPFPPMTQWCRVSIGLPAEMDEFCRLMGAFRSRGWA
jgi:histidinol-phosphate aminotransferase